MLHKVFLNDQDTWEDYLHGFISKRELNNLIRKADFLLMDLKEDPNPGKVFRRGIRIIVLKRFILRTMKRIRSFRR